MKIDVSIRSVTRDQLETYLSQTRIAVRKRIPMQCSAHTTFDGGMIHVDTPHWSWELATNKLEPHE